ncbi:MAG: helix-turn-helix domain-containing protein [Candidatus Paceibacterota bacterium]|jgi:excisionase family DNA binding protein
MSYADDIAHKINKIPTEAEEKGLQRRLTGKERPRQNYFNFIIPKDRSFFTPEEVARVLLFSPQTVWRWCRLDLIPSVRVGRFYRILLDDFAVLLKNRKIL